MCKEKLNIVRAIPWIIGGLVLATVAAFFFGFFMMLLWNWLMPVIFGLGTITYWQAWGLVLLAHILFKTGYHGHGQDHYEEHWKTKFQRKFRERYHIPEKEPHEKEIKVEKSGFDSGL